MYRVYACTYVCMYMYVCVFISVFLLHFTHTHTHTGALGRVWWDRSCDRDVCHALCRVRLPQSCQTQISQFPSQGSHILYMYMYIHTYMYVYTCMYYMYMYMYVCMFVCTCMYYIHVHVHVHVCMNHTQIMMLHACSNSIRGAIWHVLALWIIHNAQNSHLFRCSHLIHMCMCGTHPHSHIHSLTHTHTSSYMWLDLRKSNILNYFEYEHMQVYRPQYWQ